MAEAVPATSPPRFNLLIALVCVGLGAAAFAWLTISLDTGYIGASSPGMDPRLTFVLTPVFLLPLFVYARIARRMRILPMIPAPASQPPTARQSAGGVGPARLPALATDLRRLAIFIAGRSPFGGPYGPGR